MDPAMIQPSLPANVNRLCKYDLAYEILRIQVAIRKLNTRAS